MIERSCTADAESFTLPRTGDAPLAFEGELVAEADGEHQHGYDQIRWHLLAIYRTMGGKYVVHIAYRTLIQGEHKHDYTTVCGSAAEAAAEICGYEPVLYVPMNGRPDAVSAQIRRRYDLLVSEVLANDVFAEHVD